MKRSWIVLKDGTQIEITKPVQQVRVSATTWVVLE